MTDLLRTYDAHGHLTDYCGLGCRQSKATLCRCICGGRAHNRPYQRAVNSLADNLTDVLRQLKILGHARVWVHPHVLEAHRK